MVRLSRLRVLDPPDGCSQRFADTKANGDGDAHDQYDDHDFDYDSVAPAEALHARARAVLLAGLGSLFPVALIRPDLTILLARQNHTSARLVDGAMCCRCFDVRLKRVAAIGLRGRAARCSFQAGGRRPCRRTFDRAVGDGEIGIGQGIALLDFFAF